MKKRLLALTMAMIMVAGTMAACGGNTDTPATGDTGSTDPGSTDSGTTPDPGNGEDGDTPAPTTDLVTGGDTLTIYCWNDEFKTRVTDHYADYTVVDATHGTIGDTPVEWIITPNEGNGYQNKLDEDLLNGVGIDMFLIEADYALKYVDAEYSLPISALGIEASEYADQYQYTKDIVTDSNGVLKGLSWQGCPCVMFYNRSIATEVLGSDDPDAVQAAVKDWDTFNETAAQMADAGYYMTSSVADTYRVYQNNVTTPWVVDGKINIDANLERWVEDSMAMVEAKETRTHDLWSDDWSAGFKTANNNVFCYFGPAWFINFSMTPRDDDGNPQEGTIGAIGGWGACVGPQSCYWGGTWICAASTCDNMDLVADIMRELTMNADVMKGIVEADDDFVNNQPAMEAMANTDYTSDILGGQNPLPLYCEGVLTLDLSNLTAYDQACNEEFQKAMRDYFDGNATYEEALERFYNAVQTKHPELTH